MIFRPNIAICCQVSMRVFKSSGSVPVVQDATFSETVRTGSQVHLIDAIPRNVWIIFFWYPRKMWLVLWMCLIFEICGGVARKKPVLNMIHAPEVCYFPLPMPSPCSPQSVNRKPRCDQQGIPVQLWNWGPAIGLESVYKSCATTWKFFGSLTFQKKLNYCKHYHLVI